MLFQYFGEKKYFHRNKLEDRILYTSFINDATDDRELQKTVEFYVSTR